MRCGVLYVLLYGHQSPLTSAEGDARICLMEDALGVQRPRYSALNLDVLVTMWATQLTSIPGVLTTLMAVRMNMF